ncbi:hypothetical protein ACOSQ2_006362 [Xanthoceras sorbifolium]
MPAIRALDLEDYISGVLGQVTQWRTSLEMWSKLQRVYSQQSLAKILQLRQQLQNIKKGSDSIYDFILKIKNIGDALIAAGEEVSERDLLMSLMNGVGHDYDPVIHLIHLQTLCQTILITTQEMLETEVTQTIIEEIDLENEEEDLMADLLKEFIANCVLNLVMVLCNAIGVLINNFRDPLVLHALHFPYNVNAPLFCDSCKFGKQHKLPFVRYEIHATAPLQLLYSDVWEPAPLLSVEGYMYYVVFVDAFTRFT